MCISTFESSAFINLGYNYIGTAEEEFEQVCGYLAKFDVNFNEELAKANFENGKKQKARQDFTSYAESKGLYNFYTENEQKQIGTGYTNFFANQEEQLIRALDYGAYQSYILTSGESRELKYTDSFYLYTTVYDHWKDNIVNNYNNLKDGYLAMGNSSVKSRTVLEPGLVKITYSNGKVIQIDYRNLCYKVEGGKDKWIYL